MLTPSLKVGKNSLICSLEQSSILQILIEETICKVFILVLSLRSKPPPTCEKRLLNFGYQKDDLRKLYPLPFEITKEVKLLMFQCKIIHNILCTKSLLFEMKKEVSPRCPFCPADHTIVHPFTESAQATFFWKEFWIGPRAW